MMDGARLMDKEVKNKKGHLSIAFYQVVRLLYFLFQLINFSLSIFPSEGK